jgi:crossover junction endodeoxyribonuclease RuvC
MKYIVGLDLSLSSTGVAIFNQDGKLKKVMTIETSPKLETQIRLKKIGEELLKIKKEYNPTISVLEEGFVRFNTSTKQLYRVHGIAQYIFADIEQKYYFPMTIRKIVCGKGNVDKEYMRNEVLKLFPKIKFKNYDESDAVGIGLAYFMDKERT